MEVRQGNKAGLFALMFTDRNGHYFASISVPTQLWGKPADNEQWSVGWQHLRSDLMRDPHHQHAVTFIPSRLCCDRPSSSKTMSPIIWHKMPTACSKTAFRETVAISTASQAARVASFIP